MKKQLLILGLITTTVLSSFAQISTDSLIAYYPFTNNASDQSGKGNNGTVNGAILTTDRFGIANSAYQFDGTSAYIFVANSILPNTSVSFSINYWALNASGTTNGTVISDRFGSDCGFKYNSAVNTTGKYSFGTHIPTPWTANSIVSPNSISTTQWVMNTCIYNKDSAKIYLYENGVLIGSTSNNIWSNQTNGTTIGALQGCSTPMENYFTGKIDDIRIYNRAIPLSEITALYNEGVCKQTITVTDTLIISNPIITGFNPLTYSTKIKMYPNPTKSDLMIDFGDVSKWNGYTVKIMNAINQTVYQKAITTQTETVSFSTWTGTGIYFVHIIDSNGATIDIRKIVLQ